MARSPRKPGQSSRRASQGAAAPTDVAAALSMLQEAASLESIKDLIERRPQIERAITLISDRLTEQRVEIDTLRAGANEYQATTAQLQSDSTTLRNQIAAQERDIAKLRSQAAAPGAASRTTPGALADSFRKVVDQFLAQERAQSGSGPATTIRSMDIEAKVALDIGDDGGAVLLLPGAGNAIDASQLSTLRVSFAAIPGVGTGTPPSVTSIVPASGPQAGGTPIQLQGNGLTGVGAVLFGTTPVTSLQITSDTALSAVSPAGTGTVDVIVIGPSGARSAPGANAKFAYFATPAVSAIKPATGPAAGGVVVQVMGSGFTGATSVRFGTVAAREFKPINDAALEAASPPGAGAVDVTVTGPGGTSATTPADRFTYGPIITAVLPARGAIAGGTAVRITGSSLTGASAVRFGNLPAASYTIVSDTEIQAVSPKAAAAGTVNVIVTSTVGVSSVGAPNQFTYF